MSKKKLGAALASLVVMLIVAFVRSEGFHSSVERTINEATGWGEEARRSDPVGYLNFVEVQLTKDLGKMQKTRQTLSAEMSSITGKENELLAKHSYAQAMADQFRSAWKGQSFPVEIRNAAYTKEQAESQVSILLAQIDGYNESLERVRKARHQSEERVEQLTVQVVRTETNLALIDTQRELLKAKELTSTSDELVAQVDALFTDNQSVISGSPVRSVEELMASNDGMSIARASSRDRVRDFLNADAEMTTVASDGVTSP